MVNGSNEFIDAVYETLSGVLDLRCRMPGVENAFAPGEKCESWYQQVYDAERRLERRLGLDGKEDPDVEAIVSAMTEIQRELCYKMYYYGTKFGMQE